MSDVGAYRRQNWETLDLVDDGKVERLAGATARAGVYVTPTLAFFRLWFATELSDEEVRGRPDYAHIPAKMRDGYERARAQYWKNPPSEAHRARYIAIRNRMVKAIVDSGGHLWACRMSADMNHLTEADLYDEVEAIISASDFIEMTEGAQLLFI